MKEKVITIKPKGISQKQWANLLLELNLVKKAWRPYGVDIQINAPGLKNILKWGTKRYDAKSKGAHGKDADNISFIIRRNPRSRKVRTWKRDAGK